MKDQKVIGIVGGGQLAKNLTLAAHPLGFKVIVVEPGDSCPAAQAGAEQISADLYNEKALLELGSKCDFLTVEIEHLNTSALIKLSKSGRVKIRPRPETVELIQDKLAQKEFFFSKKLPVAPFKGISTKSDALKLLKKFKSPIMLKTRFGAYNGLGNALVRDAKDLDAAWKKLGGAKLYAEKIIPFAKELAVMAARDSKGNIALHPIVETIHRRNICQETLAPAQIDKGVARKAKILAQKVLSTLNDVGIFGIEMFLAKEGEVLINEVAPRVHNSGHYTLDGCLTSQFDQHLRAIVDLPLGDTSLVAPSICMINILGERNGPTRVLGLEEALSVPKTFVHIYGKSPTKIDRKMGHINAIGDTIKQARLRARRARRLIDI